MTQVAQGIYLETKQSKVGTGHTASRVTFKNYYALVLQGQQAVLHLLDDNLELTGLRESVPLSQVAPRLEYQPDLQANFLALLPKLSAKAAAPAPAPRPTAQPPQERPAAQPPQTRPTAQPPQERPAAQPPQTRPTPSPPQTRPTPSPPAKTAPAGQTPWWELTQKGAANLLKKD